MSTGWLPQTWQDWGAFVVVFGGLATALYFLLRAKMGNDFMTAAAVLDLHKQNVLTMQGLHNDHRELVNRVAAMEQTMAALPTKVDMQRNEDLVGKLASNIARMEGVLHGIQEGNNRVFNQVQLLVRAQIERDEKK